MANLNQFFKEILELNFVSGGYQVSEHEVSVENTLISNQYFRQLLDNQNLTTETTYIDDSYGNLQNNNDKIVISKIDIESGSINFIDVSDYVYSGLLGTAIGDFDIENNTLKNNKLKSYIYIR